MYFLAYQNKEIKDILQVHSEYLCTRYEKPNFI